ncbi:MAG: tRNA (adenosine(37)-N6)-dimethylallyltransferase MiaA [Candidatus Bipolaricaulota bacterium]|nr:tRNA (adenosine(37)-N6)-dimethylallyltransferase MiaA [Candidatus Bipolaricaulota bacterium]
MPAAPAVLVLLGPTATGKTAVAVELALRLGGEILSADSRAFFAGLDIVTDKPSVAERRGVPHHLIDCVPIDGEVDAMAFRADVARLVPEIAGRGRVPILAGGGTLYIAAVLRGIFEGPGKSDEFRRSLDDVASEELHRRLAQVDPTAAGAIHPRDRLRVVRALEVEAASGRPITDWKVEAVPLPFRFKTYGLLRDRDDHRAAVEARARAMMDRGLVEEVARLRASGLTSDSQAYRSVGVPEALAYLDGAITRDELLDRIVRATWALVRRQASWFRAQPGVSWVRVTGRTACDVADEIVAAWRSEREAS